MSLKKIRATSLAFVPGQVPKEIQLWNFGDNPTDYGVHKWTERSIREVGGVYAKRGNPLQIDIEHNLSEEELEKTRQIDPTAIPVTGGYAQLEMRGRAPWLVFDWSAPAVEQLETKQRTFLSPDYWVDEKTGEIVGLDRVSLVGSPGTHCARRLARCAPSSAVRSVLATVGVRAFGGSMDPKLLLAAIRAALAPEDPAVAKDGALKMIDELTKSFAEPEAPMADSEPALAAAAAPPPAEDEQKPITASAETEDKPVAASAATSAAPAAVHVAASVAPAGPSNADVLVELDGMKRDNLLREKGHRLAVSVRTWAAKQTYAVVAGMIDASPEPETSTKRVAANTRGAGAGRAAPSPESENLRARMGLTAPTNTVRREGTAIVFGVQTPEQARQRIAARAAKNGGQS